MTLNCRSLPSGSAASIQAIRYLHQSHIQRVRIDQDNFSSRRKHGYENDATGLAVVAFHQLGAKLWLVADKVDVRRVVKNERVGSGEWVAP